MSSFQKRVIYSNQQTYFGAKKVTDLYTAMQGRNLDQRAD